MPRSFLSYCLAAVACLALPVAACSSDDPTPTYYGNSAGGTTGQSCVTGQQISCPCAGAGAASGIQVCQSDSTFGACSGCPGSGGGGGQGASAGQTGSGQAGQGGQGPGGAGGAAGAEGCVAGQQLSCACPGSDVPGIKVCQGDGSFGLCAGCPSPGPGGSGGAGGAGGAGGGASAGQGGAPGPGVGGSAGQGNCAPFEKEAPRQLPSLLVLADQSGSMSENGSWTALVSDTPQALEKMPPQLPVGLLKFPEGKFDDTQLQTCLFNMTPECEAAFADSGCQDVSAEPHVPITPLALSLEAIAATLSSAGQAQGGSPMLWALRRAWTAAAAAPSDFGHAVVLITDSSPPSEYQAATGPFPESGFECKTQSDIFVAAAAAASGSPPVRTFVVAMQGQSDPPTFASQLAQAGGTALPGCSASAANCHHKSSPGALDETLNTALLAAVGCRFSLEGVPPEALALLKVSIQSGAQELPLLRDAGHKNGWDFTSDSSIELYGLACTSFPLSGKLIVRPGC